MRPPRVSQGIGPQDELANILAMTGQRCTEPLDLPCHWVRLLRTSARVIKRAFSGPQIAGESLPAQLALVIPLDDASAHDCTRLQIDILRKYGSNPALEAHPHITLKLGFSASETEPFEEYLEELGDAIAPFEIAIRNFDFFDEGIMFLDLEPNSTLEKLRQRILSDLAERYGIQAHAIEDERFRFHVTLAYGLPRRTFDDLRESFVSRRVDFKFNAHRIDLFYHTGHQWVTYKRAALRGHPQTLP